MDLITDTLEEVTTIHASQNLAIDRTMIQPTAPTLYYQEYQEMVSEEDFAVCSITEDQNLDSENKEQNLGVQESFIVECPQVNLDGTEKYPTEFSRDLNLGDRKISKQDMIKLKHISRLTSDELYNMIQQDKTASVLVNLRINPENGLVDHEIQRVRPKSVTHMIELIDEIQNLLWDISNKAHIIDLQKSKCNSPASIKVANMMNLSSSVVDPTESDFDQRIHYTPNPKFPTEDQISPSSITDSSHVVEVKILRLSKEKNSKKVTKGFDLPGSPKVLKRVKSLRNSFKKILSCKTIDTVV